MSTALIRKNDTVVGTRGASAGKSGKVLRVMPGAGRAIVQGLNLVKKCLRRTQDNPQGGIADREAPMALSNLLLYCPDCKKGVRVKRVQDAGRPVRKCKKCGHSFDA